MKRAIVYERGNALFLILIGIALFAGLLFAISQGRNDQRTMLTGEEGRLKASEMLQYGNSLRVVVDKMISLQNVEETNTGGRGILFSASGADAAYGVPETQPRTELFSASGGGAVYARVPDGACSSACAYEFTGQFNILGVGSASKYELAMVVLDVDPVICKQINKIQNTGWSSIPTEDEVTLTRFSGTNYGDTGGGNSVSLTGAGNIMSGLRSFCYQESAGSGRNVFVHVLRAR